MADLLNKVKISDLSHRPVFSNIFIALHEDTATNIRHKSFLLDQSLQIYRGSLWVKLASEDIVGLAVYC